MASPVKINATFALVHLHNRFIQLEVVDSTDHLLLSSGQNIYSYATLFAKCMAGKSKSVKIFIFNNILHFKGEFTYTKRWSMHYWYPNK